LSPPTPATRSSGPKPSPSPPRGISVEGIRKLIAVVPETPAGLRDRAIILTLVLTGRRRAEVFNLKVGDLIRTDGLFYTYRPVFLFSGGLDSLCAVVEAAFLQGKKPLLVGHSPAYHIMGRQRRLAETLGERHGGWNPFPYPPAVSTQSWFTR
jgi:hypothetical protein